MFVHHLAAASPFESQSGVVYMTSVRIVYFKPFVTSDPSWRIFWVNKRALPHLGWQGTDPGEAPDLFSGDDVLALPQRKVVAPS